MNQLTVTRIPAGIGTPEVGSCMEQSLFFHEIGKVNWAGFPVRPEVEVCLCHDSGNIYLLFRVNESSMRAIVTEPNGPVYMDSCVELFISPRSDGSYYNFEFNAIGTVLAAYGRGRDERTFLDTGTLSRIETIPSMGRDPLPSREGEVSWKLLVRIPADIFIHDDITDLGGLESMGNLYKCGDRTADPHYLSLWPVPTEKPDFHRYEFFRRILFD